MYVTIFLQEVSNNSNKNYETNKLDNINENIFN